MDNLSKNTKKCTNCHRTYPRTSKHFFFVKRHNRPNSYAQPMCKPCSRDFSKKYRQEHRSKLIASQRVYDKSTKGVYKKLRNSLRGHKVLITQAEFTEWYESQTRICLYCGLKEEHLALVFDRFNNRVFRLTIDRMDCKKPYEKGNLALACFRCNHIKGDFFSASEMAVIGKLFIAPKWSINGNQT